MARVIELDQEYKHEHRLGKFLDDSDYDVLIDEDVDVYKPKTDQLISNQLNEDRVLVKVRKNFISQELQQAAYQGLEKAASVSRNRGIAAGAVTQAGQGHAHIVTETQERILDFFIKDNLNNSLEKDTDERVQELINLFDAKSNKERTRTRLWIEENTKEFDFDSWVKQACGIDPEKAKREAEDIANTMISNTQYANVVHSGIGGYFDRYPRIPHCRAAGYTIHHEKEWNMAIPYINACSEKFKELMPTRYAYQKSQCDKIDKDFLVGDSVYTTLTINKNYRTAAHRDAGDLKKGFGNIVCIGNDVEFQGAYLVFPRYRVAVKFRPGDMICFDPHEIHGNTELEEVPGSERITIVMYFRENMLNCESKSIEDLRGNFVEYRKNNKDHPEWRKYWNGVSPKMWESQEWVDYLMMNGMNDYVEEHLIHKTNPNTLF